MMILGCRALSRGGRILLGGITVGGEGGNEERENRSSTEGRDGLRGTTCGLVGYEGLGHPRDKGPKGERPERGREEGGYPPTPKGGVRRGIQESQGKSDERPIQRKWGFEGLSRLS